MLPRTRPSRLKNTEPRLIFHRRHQHQPCQNPLKTLNSVSVIKVKQLVTFPRQDRGHQIVAIARYKVEFILNNIWHAAQLQPQTGKKKNPYISADTKQYRGGVVFPPTGLLWPKTISRSTAECFHCVSSAELGTRVGFLLSAGRGWFSNSHPHT